MRFDFSHNFYYRKMHFIVRSCHFNFDVSLWHQIWQLYVILEKDASPRQQCTTSQHDMPTNPIQVQCWTAGAGQHPFNTGQWIVLAGWRACLYNVQDTHNISTQCLLKVGPVWVIEQPARYLEAIINAGPLAVMPVQQLLRCLQIV